MAAWYGMQDQTSPQLGYALSRKDKMSVPHNMWKETRSSPSIHVHFKTCRQGMLGTKVPKP